jgi:hypothetical protein
VGPDGFALVGVGFPGMSGSPVFDGSGHVCGMYLSRMEHPAGCHVTPLRLAKLEAAAANTDVGRASQQIPPPQPLRAATEAAADAGSSSEQKKPSQPQAQAQSPSPPPPPPRPAEGPKKDAPGGFRGIVQRFIGITELKATMEERMTSIEERMATKAELKAQLLDMESRLHKRMATKDDVQRIVDEMRQRDHDTLSKVGQCAAGELLTRLAVHRRVVSAEGFAAATAPATDVFVVVPRSMGLTIHNPIAVHALDMGVGDVAF